MLKLVDVHNWVVLLPPPLQAEVRARMRQRHYRDGEAVWRIGEPALEMFQIRTGKVRVSSESVSGVEFVAAVLQPGDCMGEGSLIDGLPRINNAYAAGEADLLVMKKQDFLHFYRTRIDLVHALNVILIYRLRMAYAGAQDASALPLRQRLAKLLARLGYSFGQCDSSGAASVRDVSHEDLAQMLGVTRQAVSRALKELESEGMIRLGYRRVDIPDLAVLAKPYYSLVGEDTVAPDYRPR